jgi:putative transposase
MILSNVNTNCMNAFLKNLSEQLREEKAILVVDCAGWHRSKALVVPSNIMLVYLPPYSPELNPVERLWQHIKDKLIKNKVYATLDALEKALETLFKSLTPDLLRSLCSINYL